MKPLKKSLKMLQNRERKSYITKEGLSSLQEDYAKRNENREKLRQEKERKQRVDEQIYMLRNNLHYKRHCYIDEEKEIFVKTRKRSTGTSSVETVGVESVEKRNASTPRFKHEEFAAAYKQALEKREK